jgi:hypothetical protein
VYRHGHFATISLADRMLTLQCFNATMALTSLFSAPTTSTGRSMT